MISDKALALALSTAFIGYEALAAVQTRSIKGEVKTLVSEQDYQKITDKNSFGIFDYLAPNATNRRWERSLDSLHAEGMAKKAYQAGMQAVRDSVKAAAK